MEGWHVDAIRSNSTKAGNSFFHAGDDSRRIFYFYRKKIFDGATQWNRPRLESDAIWHCAQATS